MSFFKPDASQVPAPQQPGAAPPVLSPQGSKPQAKSQRTSFLGADATPPQAQMGGMQKTLLGQ